ncbi:MAG: TrmH family RNA methyltransferase [Candidatus Limnocylindrales bacterium]
MRDAITSIQNPRVRAAVRLRDRRDRTEAGLTLVDGLRELRRALDAGTELVELYACEALCTAPRCREILERVRAAGVPITTVSEDVLSRLSFGDRVEGVLGVARLPQRQLSDLHLPEGPLVAVLEGVEKPGNIGAVMRSADGAGLSAVIAADGGTDLFNPNVIRASIGIVFSMPVAAATTSQTVAWLNQNGLQIVAASLDATIDYAEIDYTGPTAIVLGAESVGLSDAWTGPEVSRVRLPMLGVADSLSVSAAAAVLFYEARRQRGRPAE